MAVLDRPLYSFAPKLDAHLLPRAMTPEQLVTSRALAAAGVVGLSLACVLPEVGPDGVEINFAEHLPDLGPDGDTNGGRILGKLRGWEVAAPTWEGGAWSILKPGQGYMAHTLAHVAALAWLKSLSDAGEVS